MMQDNVTHFVTSPGRVRSVVKNAAKWRAEPGEAGTAAGATQGAPIRFRCAHYAKGGRALCKTERLDVFTRQS